MLVLETFKKKEIFEKFCSDLSFVRGNSKFEDLGCKIVQIV